MNLIYFDRNNLLFREGDSKGAPVLAAPYTREPIRKAEISVCMERIVACVNVCEGISTDDLENRRVMILQSNPTEGGTGKQTVDCEPGAEPGGSARSLPEDLHLVVDRVLAKHGIGEAVASRQSPVPSSREWIIQRCMQCWVGTELQYEDFPTPEGRMTREQMVTVLERVCRQHPDKEFRGHNVANSRGRDSIGGVR